MPGSSLSTMVLDAGGSIESRCLIKDLPGFTDQYVFTKESLEHFIEIVKEQNNERIEQTSGR